MYLLVVGVIGMKVTYQAVIDTTKREIRVYGRKLNAIYDHVSYKNKQRSIFLEGMTANQMKQRLAAFQDRGFKVRYSVCCNGGMR